MIGGFGVRRTACRRGADGARRPVRGRRGERREDAVSLLPAWNRECRTRWGGGWRYRRRNGAARLSELTAAVMLKGFRRREEPLLSRHLKRPHVLGNAGASQPSSWGGGGCTIDRGVERVWFAKDRRMRVMSVLRRAFARSWPTAIGQDPIPPARASLGYRTFGSRPGPPAEALIGSS